MKHLLLLILASSICFADTVWERSDGPYGNVIVRELFFFNDTLFAKLSPKNGRSHIYKYETDDWKLVEAQPTAEELMDIQSNEYVSVIANEDSFDIKYAGSNSWKTVSNPFRMYWQDPFGSIVLSNDQIIAIGKNAGYLKRFNRDSSGWEFVTTKFSSGDTLLADVVSHRDSIIFINNFKKRDSFKNRNIEFGTYLSTNNGREWEKITTLGKQINASIFYKDKLIVCAADSMIYSSTDLGNTWEKLSDRVLAVTHFISDGDIIFAITESVGSEIALSTDGGITWNSKNIPLRTRDTKQIYYYGGEFLVISWYGNIFKYNRDTEEWEMFKFVTRDVGSSDIIISGDTLFVCTNGKNGLFYSTNNGGSWQDYSASLSRLQVQYEQIVKEDSVIMIKNSFSLFATISSNNGKDWIETQTGFGTLQPFITKVAIAGNRLLVSTNFGLRVSEDMGKSWEAFGDGVLNYGTVAYAMTEDSKSNLYLISDSSLIKSTNNGINWLIEAKGDLLDINVSKDLRVIDGKYYICAEWNIYEYNPQTKVWDIKLSIDKTKSYFADFEYINGTFIVPTNRGVIVADSTGEQHSYLLSEQDTSKNTFTTLLISGNYLFATSKNGVWRAKLSDLGITPTSVETQTERNYLYTFPPYPNPARGEVKVLFYWDINLPMNVEDISIYDLSGKKIDAEHTLSLEKIGNHYGNLVWDCSATPSGIYLINIKHSTEERTVKVIVE